MVWDSFHSTQLGTGSVLFLHRVLCRYYLHHDYRTSSFIAVLWNGKRKHEVMLLAQGYRGRWWQQNRTLKFPGYCDLCLMLCCGAKGLLEANYLG